MNKRIILLCSFSLSTIVWASDRHQEQKLRRKELNVGVFSHQGEKFSQEDTYAVFGKGEFSCVCDGHGGIEAARIANEWLPNAFLKHLAMSKGSDLSKEKAFKAAIQEVEKRIVEDDANEKSGSTLVAAYVGKNNFHLAWVGDSRIVCGSDQGITASTQDHNIKSALEKERVLKAGSTIYREMRRDRSVIGPWRVRGLVPTRTLGDAFAKKDSGKNLRVHSRPGHVLQCESDLKELHSSIIIKVKPNQIIAEPDYLKVPIDEKSPFIVLASDGLWDVMTNEEVMQQIDALAGAGLSMDCIAKALVNNAQMKGSFDNITVIVLDIRPRIKK